MTIFSRFTSVAAIAAMATIMSFGAAEAKNFKIAVGDSGGSSQEATGKAFVEALEELSGGKHTATLFLNGQLGSEMAERQKEFWQHVSDEDKDIQNQVASIELVDGYPAEVILRRASELGCDLIIIGADEHGFSHTFLGTVAKRVLRRSSIPTLVVPYRDIETNT